MKRVTALAAAAAMVAALCVPEAVAAGPPGEPGAIPGAWIVTLHDGVEPGAVAADHARSDHARVSHVYTHALHGYAAGFSDRAAAHIAADPRVRTVVPDRVMTVAQSVPTGIRRSGASSNETAKIDGVDERVDVDVAVIDTGIDVEHPDLNVVGGVDCSGSGTWDDFHGHGTHVAGTVGAIDNGIGVVGVAPGARLHAVRVFETSTGDWSQIICGVDWVTGHADTIEVANMSLSGSAPEGSCIDGGLHEAVCAMVAAGVTTVVAAGNWGADAADYSPANYDEVITVSALADYDGLAGGLSATSCGDGHGPDDTLATFSNYGPDVDLIAPGECILSTWVGGGLNTSTGTSMASPHVAGAAALIAATDRTATPASIRQQLIDGGSQSWDSSSDPDGIHEPLLDISGPLTGLVVDVSYAPTGRQGQHAIVTLRITDDGAPMIEARTLFHQFVDGVVTRSYTKATDRGGKIVIKVRDGSVTCVRMDVVTVAERVPDTEIDPGSAGCGLPTTGELPSSESRG